jgi:hypothetical protein
MSDIENAKKKEGLEFEYLFITRRTIFIPFWNKNLIGQHYFLLFKQ